MAYNFLGKQFYLIESTPAATPEELAKKRDEHLAHQVRIEKEGILFAAGPLANADGAAAGGLIVIRAKDFAEAKAIADSDPFHRSGLRKYTLRRWTVNEGSYTVRVNYSDQSVAIE